jgi:hypothetical protein
MKTFSLYLLLTCTAGAAEKALIAGELVVSSRQGASDLVVADFDGDGHDDFLVVRDLVLEVRLGRGDGTFGPVIDTAANLHPIAIKTADFDRDGHVDLAIHSIPEGIVVFHGRGDGSFIEGTTISTDFEFQTAFAAGDFTGDGAPDLLRLVPAPASSPDLAVLPGDGHGHFGTPIVTPAGVDRIFIGGVAGVADFDGDGKLDVLVAADEDAYVRYGTGNGRFGRSAKIASGGGSLVAVADFNSDGRPDWAFTAMTSSESGYTRAVINGADGTFRAVPLTVPFDGAMRAIAAADITGDGVDDVVAILGGPHIAVVASNNDGTFRAADVYLSATNGDALATGRFDAVPGDDVLTAHFQGDVLLARSGAAGTLAIHRAYMTGAPMIDEYDAPPSSSIQLADATADGKPDAIVLGSIGDDLDRRYTLTVLPNDGHGHLGAPVYTPTALADGGYGVGSASADFTGDGTTDVAVVTYGSIHLYAGRAGGTFDAPVVTVEGNANPGAVDTPDVNGDGRPDLLFVRDMAIAVSLNEGGGRFARSVVTPLVPEARSGYALADFNADGALDVAVASTVVMLGSADGSFTVKKHPLLVAGKDEKEIGAGDFDEDGLPDLITQTGFALSFHRGNGDGTLAAPAAISFDRKLTASGRRGLRSIVADIDGDRHLDLVNVNEAVRYLPAVTEVLLGDGRGSFRGAESILHEDRFAAIAVADLDGNGSLDIGAVNRDVSAVGVILTNVTEKLDRPVEITATTIARRFSYGDEVVVDVTVTDARWRQPATGTVLLRDDGRTVRIAHLDTRGHTTFAVTSDVGAHELTATFPANAVFAAADASPVHYEVVKALTILSVSASSVPNRGFNYLFDLRGIVSSFSVEAAMTGVVTVKIAGFPDQTFEAAQLGGRQFVPAEPGTYRIEVEYSGNERFESSRAATTVTVGPERAEVALLVRPGAYVSAGAPVTLTALVYPATAGGSVTFFDGDVALVTVPVRNGAATVTTTVLLGGRHLLHAVYSGDATFAGPSRSRAVYVTLAGAPPPRRRSAGK